MNKVERRKLFPLTALATTTYPADEEMVTAFFPEFLELSAAGQPRDVALFRTNGATFVTVAELEQQFFEYAADNPEDSPPDH